jgi:hypothetical protein
MRIPVFDLKMAYTLWADTSARCAIASMVIPAYPSLSKSRRVASTMRRRVSPAWRWRTSDL